MMSPVNLLVAAVLAAVSATAISGQQPTRQTTPSTRHPDSAQLVTDDLQRFRQALLILQQATAGIDTIEVLAREYFAHASPGFRAYITRYELTPEQVAAAMRRYPKYYASLHTLESDVSRNEARIRAAFAELQRLHPKAVFPPVYFFVGNVGAGGLTRPEGLLISTELFASTRARSTDEFHGAAPRVQSIDRLPYLVAHELLHYQQAVAQGLEAYRAIFGPRQNLLALAIREGSADFLSTMISGGTVYSEVHAFARPRERELWLQFRNEMHRREPGDWMFSRPSQSDWPMDLGYFIGYRIAESFYNHATDKERAVQEILGVTNYDAFLEASRYAERFR